MEVGGEGKDVDYHVIITLENPSRLRAMLSQPLQGTHSLLGEDGEIDYTFLLRYIMHKTKRISKEGRVSE